MNINECVDALNAKCPKGEWFKDKIFDDKWVICSKTTSKKKAQSFLNDATSWLESNNLKWETPTDMDGNLKQVMILTDLT